MDPADVPARDWGPICLALRDADGAILGRLYGATMWSWLIIDGCGWRKSCAERGSATSCLRGARRSRRSGGAGSVAGFRQGSSTSGTATPVFAERPGCPGGHSRFHLQRRLGPRCRSFRPPSDSAPMKRLINAVWRTLAGFARPSRRANLRRLARRGESLASLRIREATAADVAALARLHVTTSNATYGPLGSKGPNVEVRERQWRAGFAKNDPDWFCLVVERPDGALVGFAQANRSDNPEFAGELRRLHLLLDYQRMGLGRRLVGHVARRFLRRGITSMWLSGDARNPSSRAWKALGAEKCDDDPGNGNYGWRDITALAWFPE